MNKTNSIVAIIVAVVIIGGYFLFFQPKNDLVNQTSSLPDYDQSESKNQQQDNPAENSNPQEEVKNEVIYTDNGYTPSTLTIKVSDTVVFKNQSSGNMWTASALHPSHAVYSGTSLGEHCPDAENKSFDECKSSQPGESWSFTFDKKGTWGYHNHLKASHFGKIIVE